MGLNIKNREVERLAAEVAEMAHETKTEAIRKALEDRKVKLQAAGRNSSGEFWRWLETEFWPSIPEGVRGKTLRKEDEEAILGYGPAGV
jgi:antitoxin VapB